MSVLKFLCFASFLYLSLADPVPSADPSSPSDVQKSQSGSIALHDNEASSHEVHAVLKTIMAEMKNVLETRLEAILNGLDSEDQEYVMFTTLECIKGCLNYVRYMRKAALGSKNAVPKTDAFTLTFMASDEDDSYLPYNLDGPFISGDSDQGSYCMNEKFVDGTK